MRLDGGNQNLEIIKFAAEAYAAAGGAPSVLLQEAMEWLQDCYDKTEDPVCLEAVSLIRRAYDEMGFTRIRPSVSRVREVLGRWPRAAVKEESAGWTAEDIVRRVRNRIQGSQIYQGSKNGAVFELLVLEEGAWLLDIERQRVYLFTGE